MLKFDSYSIALQEVPDEISLAFNITGCPHKCEGCHSPYLQGDGGLPLKDHLLKIINTFRDMISCVCFMGGDQDCRSLAEAIVEVRMQYPELKIALYSGSDTLPEILFRLCDYVKVGRYIKELGGLNNPSTNQVMYKLSTKKENITSIFQPKDLYWETKD